MSFTISACCVSACTHNGLHVLVVVWKIHSKNSRDSNEMLAFKYPRHKHYGNKRWNTKLCNFIFWHRIFHYGYIMKIHPTPPPPCISVYIYIFIYMSLNNRLNIYIQCMCLGAFVIQKPYRYRNRNTVINEHYVLWIYASLFIFRCNK